jgi:hypothetical protein
MLILPAAFPLFHYGLVSLLYSIAVRNRGSAGPGGYSPPAAKPCFASAVSGEPRRAWLMGLPPPHARTPAGVPRSGEPVPGEDRLCRP